MKKEHFISALTDLIPECTGDTAEKWVVFAEELIELDQFVDFICNPNGKRAAAEDWLESIYAGIGLTKQLFNPIIARQITNLSSVPFCLYPHEMYAAAKHLANGGTTENIPNMAAEGLLDTADEDFWPMFPKTEMLAKPEIPPNIEPLPQDGLMTTYEKLLAIGMNNGLTAKENACLQSIVDGISARLPDHGGYGQEQEAEPAEEQGEEM